MIQKCLPSALFVSNLKEEQIVNDNISPLRCRPMMSRLSERLINTYSEECFEQEDKTRLTNEKMYRTLISLLNDGFTYLEIHFFTKR